jgi:outer membrane receptor protein involved in Fe transport
MRLCIPLRAFVLSLSVGAVAQQPAPAPAPVSTQITVTATRSSVATEATASTVYVIGAAELKNFPASTLDDRLRQQAGFELFRRSSSRVANPTSQGISLRGLGSTAASRSLVLEDGVPLNDPFGSWVHWNEIPQLAVDSATVATGGGSDLYGSAALGGVIDLVPARAAGPRAAVDLSGGSQATTSVAVRGDAARGRWTQLLAADDFRTGGYVVTAAGLAGAVDVPANVHYQAGRAETAYTSTGNRAFLVGNVLNEARGNGTPLQTNATRLWRYIGGDQWTPAPRSDARLRLFGSDESYRQSFTAIAASRATESLSRRQKVRTQELGASTDASIVRGPVALVAGADVRDIRATDFETPISAGVTTGVQDTSARQRFAGGFVEALAAHGGWSGALSLRGDHVANLDTRVFTPAQALTPDRGEDIFSPRLGILRQLGPRASVHAAVFRAFRTPTMNELYRTGQVGQETTQANAQLQSERATGWEAGTRLSTSSAALALTATYFWTEIDRPVSAVLVSSTATTILDKRQNLGQIRSQGTELNLEIRPRGAVSGRIGYQYANAVVTKFSAQPGLVGNWIPEVPRQTFTAQLRTELPRIAQITVAARASGQAFDDSANIYILNPFFSLDLAAHHDFGERVTASVSVQNLLNQRPDVARTPVLTQGSGIFALAGLAYHWAK